MKIRRKEAMNAAADEEPPTPPSAQTVASIDDLLVKILLRLPIKSLLRFKSVSKHWLSIVTNPQFALRRNPNPNPALGLFLPRIHFDGTNHLSKYIPFDLHNTTTLPPFDKLKFIKDPSYLTILQSCNGLLLCYRLVPETKVNFYVYNPTTDQLTTLPILSRARHRGMALAFNPAKSPHYKVVCVHDSEMEPGKCEIEIYSSVSGGPWRASGDPFTAETNFISEVYCNGAVHWLDRHRDMNKTCLYFNVDEERLGVMPPIPIPDGWNLDDWFFWRKEIYFGESCDHLHLIHDYGPLNQFKVFNVYEMKRDYSEWFVKYNVDLAPICTAFPEMVITRTNLDINLYEFYSFCIIRGQNEDDDAFLVLRIPGKVVRYNLVSKTFVKLCDLDSLGGGELYGNPHQYIESLCCV